MKKITCQQITSAINLAKFFGNEILEECDGWSAVKKDYRMKLELTSGLKEKIVNDHPELEYWKSISDPHYAPEEGFICHEHKISISFPVKK